MVWKPDTKVNIAFVWISQGEDVLVELRQHDDYISGENTFDFVNLL